MAQHTDEFRYLPTQAAALGVSVPPVRRIALTLPDGREISALRFGEDLPEVTLLHGAGLNAHTFDNVALLAAAPCLVIDLAGHGDSSWREDADYSPALLADDVVLALRAWTQTPQVLVGHSLGGLTAAIVAAEHPALVHELVLVDIVPGVDTDAAPAVLRDFYQQTDFDTREDAVERAMAFGFGGARSDTERGVFFNTRVRNDGRVEWKHHFSHIIGNAFDSLKAANKATPGADPWSPLRSTTAPITVLHGTRGFLAEADLAALGEHVPHATVIEVDAGHNIQETAPAAIADVITHALSRTPR